MVNTYKIGTVVINSHCIPFDDIYIFKCIENREKDKWNMYLELFEKITNGTILFINTSNYQISRK